MGPKWPKIGNRKFSEGLRLKNAQKWQWGLKPAVINTTVHYLFCYGGGARWGTCQHYLDLHRLLWWRSKMVDMPALPGPAQTVMVAEQDGGHASTTWTCIDCYGGGARWWTCQHYLDLHRLLWWRSKMADMPALPGPAQTTSRFLKLKKMLKFDINQQFFV